MLHFKVASRKMTIGKDKGKTKYFAQREARGVLSLRQVEDEIVQKTSLARGDVRNAIASLAEVVNSALLSGLKVDLGDLGSFGVEANGKMVATEGEVNASTIKKPQIRYNPKHEMRRYAQQVPINVMNERNNKPSGGIGSHTGHTIPSTGSPEAGSQAGGSESPSVPGIRPGHNL